MSLFEFIQWCFRNEDSTIVTIFLLCTLSWFVKDVIKAFKN